MKPVQLYPASWRLASEFVRAYHRHHAPPQGYLWAIAAWHGIRPLGVAIVGRPVSRVLAARGYVEVTRMTTIAWGIARVLLIECERRSGGPICTYTQAGEDGASLRHAGWVPVHVRRGAPSDWNSPARRRRAVPSTRTRWEPAAQVDAATAQADD